MAAFFVVFFLSLCRVFVTLLIYNLTCNVIARIVGQKGNTNMDEKLISKKDLLNLEQISYGTLYRWKRQGLIPENWFIHKATDIGQATFFPEEKIPIRLLTSVRPHSSRKRRSSQGSTVSRSSRTSFPSIRCRSFSPLTLRASRSP